ncbi:polyadenylate-binding protein-interacting protein 4-like isoform X3 [Salvia hispanica]|uniref:polyadenylate-binding protein-interacting protein 4-like isoform X3 n=1 Tax=Salvia hispanica TaxID=49212 RepID=UPI002009116C|nr:polyadenylate-binding protein-interacting protein 4-like isoform X3 [Salvia hispanica]
MNMQQAVQSRSSANGYGRRKVEKDSAARSDSKFHTGKANYSRTSSGKGGILESPSRDRLIYLTACLIGHQVEVQVMDGSVFSGIFHATNAEDFGIVLKMAHLIKDGSQGKKDISDALSNPSPKTLIIPANDLIQVIAKGVPVMRDGLSNELQYERQQELLTDSCISQSRHVDLGRELERWIPDENNPSYPDLENIFDSPWKRGWDQFEANATLFGVKSTFNEELYTTKLEKGPQMRELEKEAMRIAREIEGEDTGDLHLAEERGRQLDGSVELDEETRFSSVIRSVDDSGYDEIEDILQDSRNDETFGDSLRPVIGKPPIDTFPGKARDGAQMPSRFPSLGEAQSSVSSSRDVYHSGSEDRGTQILNEQLPKESSGIYASRVLDNQYTGHAESSSVKDDKDKPVSLDRGGSSKTDAEGDEKASSSNELSEGALPPKTQGAAHFVARPNSSASSTSDRGGAASTSASRGLSSSSSVGSLSSEKSSLNPYAKEFKLNPNAKSFTPSQSSMRPSSPVADGPFYYPANVAPMTQMHGMPVNIGAAPLPQPYYHPNGPQYGQQMMIGQHRPVLYMPTYPAEMPYNKGREF